ncbi:hypothetical protein ACIRPK_20620 [Kitasatospora sp. NPDC101801]|uniref:hypothetical protein n=1 Tax=Kitasatospora sp. NPDC101801 TaxID=3364103 RepID=UPI0038007A29
MNLRPASPTVLAVLLADGWHDVEPGTFTTGTFSSPAGGRQHGSRRSAKQTVGFAFTATDGQRIAGPFTSVHALRSAPALETAPQLPQWCGSCNDGKPTANPSERWVESENGRLSRCPDCNPNAGATADAQHLPWCGRCQASAARWTLWRYEKDGNVYHQSIPCPQCHPDPQQLLIKVPRARASYEACMTLLKISAEGRARP